ncbi:MAG: type II secretion system F family protein [Chloroflexi bacterium]|nr:type II secretion system F family protein [Chloroflexota bacterium]
MLVRFEAYNRAGQPVKGMLEAASPRAAEDMLWQRDLIVARVRRASPALQWHKLLPAVFGLRPAQTIGLVRQLASLLEAGVPLLRALRILVNERSHPAIRDAGTEILRSLEEGAPFSDATALHPNVFPSLVVQMARIGEQTGKLPAMLRRAADQMEARTAFQGKLRGALTYPAMVTMAALGSLYILVTFSVPMLSRLFTELNAELPPITRFVMVAGQVAKTVAPVLLVGLAILGIGMYIYRRTPRGRVAVDWLLLGAPVIGSLSMKGHIAQMTQTLGVLLSSGIPLLQAVETVRDNSDNRAIRALLDEMRQRLLQGTSFSSALEETRRFPPLLLEMVQVGEEIGKLGPQLSLVSDIYRQEFEDSVKRFVSRAEPTLILGVGVVVAVVGMTIISTIYGALPQVAATP